MKFPTTIPIGWSAAHHTNLFNVIIVGFFSRTERTDWYKVLKLSIQFILGWVVHSFFYRRIFFNHLSDIGSEGLRFQTILGLLPLYYACSISSVFIAFYSFFHCWLNIWAEILRFGDREFYGDWWNASRLSQFSRRWNLPVHYWLHCYLFKPLVVSRAFKNCS